MVTDLIERLQAVLGELKAEGNADLAERVEQAIRDLQRGQFNPPAGYGVSSHGTAHRVG